MTDAHDWVLVLTSNYVESSNFKRDVGDVGSTKPVDGPTVKFGI